MGFMFMSSAKAETADNARIVTAADVVLPVIRVPYDYPTVQQAIDAAPPGSTILVSSGTYAEHLLINKSLNLLGESKDSTVLDGGGNGTVMTVTANEVVVDGFKIMNGKYGVNMTRSDNSTVSGNLILSNYEGIRVVESNNDSLVGNVLANNDLHAVDLSTGSNVLGNSMVNDRLEVIGGGGNVFRHNNFLSSEVMEQLNWSNNLWDENFWDSNIYREEHHPLDCPYGSVPIIWENTIYPVELVSNASIRAILFAPNEKKIAFGSGSAPAVYCNITIPKSLMRGPWQINTPTRETVITENETHTLIYLDYNASPPYGTLYAVRVELIASWIVPEFPMTAMLLGLMLLITFSTSMLNKTKKWKMRRWIK